MNPDAHSKIFPGSPMVCGTIAAAMTPEMVTNAIVAALSAGAAAGTTDTAKSAIADTYLVVGILVVLALWLLPRWQAARSQGLTAGNRFDRENEARKTLAQIIGGVFVLAGLYSSLQTFDLQRQGQITDRFTKAIDQQGAVEPGGTLDSALTLPKGFFVDPVPVKTRRWYRSSTAF